MIVGNFGPGVGGDAEQGGFSHVGEAHQAHVRQKLQLQDDIPLLALQPRLGKPGHLPGGGGIVGVAPASATAPGDDEILPGGHIHNDLVGLGVPDHGAPGHLDDQIFSPLAGHFPALTADTGLSSILPLVAEIQQCGQIVVDMENHAAAVSSVAAIGTSRGNILLPVKGHRAVAAPAADDGNANFIYKHKHTSLGNRAILQTAQRCPGQCFALHRIPANTLFY